MNGIIWVLVGAVAGWLTGKILATESDEPTSNATKRFDVLSGILGAFIGGYLFFWTVMGPWSDITRYGTAILGSIVIVGLTRVVSERWRLSSID